MPSYEKCTYYEVEALFMLFKLDKVRYTRKTRPKTLFQASKYEEIVNFRPRTILHKTYLAKVVQRQHGFVPPKTENCAMPTTCVYSMEFGNV